MLLCCMALCVVLCGPTPLKHLAAERFGSLSAALSCLVVPGTAFPSVPISLSTPKKESSKRLVAEGRKQGLLRGSFDICAQIQIETCQKVSRSQSPPTPRNYFILWVGVHVLDVCFQSLLLNLRH